MSKSLQRLISVHVKKLNNCDMCPLMHKPVVSGEPIVSKVILVGQAPGVKEPILGKPFAWTAGKTMFRWFRESCGISEDEFRSKIYMAAVCRCFPGKNNKGGDRVPNNEEIINCSSWLNSEIKILKPDLVIAVGKLAIIQFIEYQKLEFLISKSFNCENNGHSFDMIPLPHPSGASPWPRTEPGKTLTQKALKKISNHPAIITIKNS